MENWKGKNNSPKKRGRYLTVCPDIENIHLKPKFTTSVPLLKNGSTLGPVVLGNSPTMLINTCPFDAIVQSLLVGYYDWTNFHHYIEQTQNDMFEFIKQLSTCGPSIRMYKERAFILNKFITSVHGTMNCHYNISNLIAKHLLKDEFSCSINVLCRNCQHVRNDNFNVLDINVKSFYEENMRALQHSINERYTNKNTRCIRCAEENIECSVVCGQLLFIDIECLQSIRLAKNLNISDWEGTFTLSHIPVDLLFHDYMYKLLAVIEYQGTSDRKCRTLYCKYTQANKKMENTQ